MTLPKGMSYNCTRCGNPTPWRTFDINKEALCYSCSIKPITLETRGKQE